VNRQASSPVAAVQQAHQPDALERSARLEPHGAQVTRQTLRRITTGAGRWSVHFRGGRNTSGNSSSLGSPSICRRPNSRGIGHAFSTLASTTAISSSVRP